MNGTLDLDRYRRNALIAGGAGFVLTLLGLFFDPTQFFRSYLWAYWFWLGVGIGALQMLMLYHLTGGRWGLLSQRVLEAEARTLLPMFVLVIPLLFGISRLYPWATPEGAQQYSHKALYLNVPFFLVRLVIYFAIWGALSWFMGKWSRDEDITQDSRFWRRRAALSGPGIVLCTFAVAFASIDWMMSIEPAWFSTIYPLIHAVGQVLAGLAIAIIVLVLLADRPPLDRVGETDVFHDLGNLLLAFTVLWAYVSFSQLLIIWAGNLPKEILWYSHRLRGGWQYLALWLVIAHFFVPFALLLLRRTKRRKPALAGVAVFIFVMRLFDYFWIVEPGFHQGGFYLHWLDITAPIGIGGLWVALFLWRLASRPLVPAHIAEEITA